MEVDLLNNNDLKNYLKKQYKLNKKENYKKIILNTKDGKHIWKEKIFQSLITIILTLLGTTCIAFAGNAIYNEYIKEKNEIKSSSLRDNNTGIIDSDWDLTQTDMVSFSTENLTLYYKIITNTEDYLVYKNRINELPEITQDTFNNNFLIIITSSSAYDLYNRDIYIDSIYADDNVTYINFAQNNPIDYTKSNNTWYAIVDNSQLRDTINIKINYTDIINNSNITQLADISTDYSIEKAIKDNCFVISNNIIISPNPSYLDEFLEHSNSENNFIRIYQKTNNSVEIFDIIYKDNFYFINRRLLSNTTIKKSVFKYIEKGNIHSNGLVRYYFTNTLSTETEYTEAFPFLSFYTK